jgi:hypothetical protein
LELRDVAADDEQVIEAGEQLVEEDRFLLAERGDAQNEAAAVEVRKERVVCLDGDGLEEGRRERDCERQGGYDRREHEGFAHG